jgi:hypothetical protein
MIPNGFAAGAIRAPIPPGVQLRPRESQQPYIERLIAAAARPQGVDCDQGGQQLRIVGVDECRSM